MSTFSGPLVGILVLSNTFGPQLSWLNGKISKSFLPQLFKISVYNLEL